MNDHIYCPYLKANVELTDEREKHIASHHPDLLPEFRDYIFQTLSEPDQIRRSVRFSNARIFSRWFNMIKGGKYVVAVVVTDHSIRDTRHWIITAYIARKLSPGDVEWKKN